MLITILCRVIALSTDATRGEERFSAAYFALYMFVFLFTELFVNGRAAELLGPASAALVYAVSITSTGVGYLLLPLLCAAVKPPSVKRSLPALFGAAALASAFIMFFSPNASQYFLPLTCACMGALGCIGALAHRRMADTFADSRSLGKISGCSICGAIVMQYILQNSGLSAGIIAAGLGAAFIALFCASAVRGGGWVCEPPALRYPVPSLNTKKQCLYLILIAVSTSLIISTIDMIVTTYQARGIAGVETYPRLFYALGLVAAGYFADIKERSYMAVSTACAMTLSMAATLFSHTPAAYAVCLAVMYFYSGFYIVFLTVSFISVAPYTANPLLWAGMGRAMRSLTTGIVALPTVKLIEIGGLHAAMLLNIAFYAVALLAFYVSGSLGYRGKTPEPRVEADTLRAFADKFALTGRETAILARIIEEDREISCLAEELGISYRSVQRHLTSVYQKTGTRNRAGLVLSYRKEGTR